jgi:hypothetical protein
MPGSTLGRPGGREHHVHMITSAHTAPARELHRSQRALVAASLLACPRDAKPARTRD